MASPLAISHAPVKLFAPPNPTSAHSVDTEPPEPDAAACTLIAWPLTEPSVNELPVM
jgi:hypothetical protein